MQTGTRVPKGQLLQAPLPAASARGWHRVAACWHPTPLHPNRGPTDDSKQPLPLAWPCSSLLPCRRRTLLPHPAPVSPPCSAAFPPGATGRCTHLHVPTARRWAAASRGCAGSRLAWPSPAGIKRGGGCCCRMGWGVGGDGDVFRGKERPPRLPVRRDPCPVPGWWHLGTGIPARWWHHGVPTKPQWPPQSRHLPQPPALFSLPDAAVQEGAAVLLLLRFLLFVSGLPWPCGSWCCCSGAAAAAPSSPGRVEHPRGTGKPGHVPVPPRVSLPPPGPRPGSKGSVSLLCQHLEEKKGEKSHFCPTLGMWMPRKQTEALFLH